MSDPDKIINEIKEVLRKHDAELTIEEEGGAWVKTQYLCLTVIDNDFISKEYNLGKAIIP